MNEPIKAGDLCEVIDGTFEQKSPNVGKRVVVRQVRGEHTQLGRIWRCAGVDLITEFGVVGTEMDFAQAWLRKLPPEAPTVKSETLSTSTT